MVESGCASVEPCLYITVFGPFSARVLVAPRIVARLKRKEHTRGNGARSDNILLAVARQTCDAPTAGQAIESV